MLAPYDEYLNEMHNIYSSFIYKGTAAPIVGTMADKTLRLKFLESLKHEIDKTPEFYQAVELSANKFLDTLTEEERKSDIIIVYQTSGQTFNSLFAEVIRKKLLVEKSKMYQFGRPDIYSKVTTEERNRGLAYYLSGKEKYRYPQFVAIEL